MEGGRGDWASIASFICWRALVTAMSSVLLFVEFGTCKEKNEWRVIGVCSAYNVVARACWAGVAKCGAVGKHPQGPRGDL